jgi:hypothetical protein
MRISRRSLSTVLLRAFVGSAQAVTIHVGAALIVTTAIAHTASAQDAAQFGRIAGRVIDAESGQGVAGVGVQVVGTTIGGMTGVDGSYTIPRVPAGTVTLQFRRIGENRDRHHARRWIGA